MGAEVGFTLVWVSQRWNSGSTGVGLNFQKKESWQRFSASVENQFHESKSLGGGVHHSIHPQQSLALNKYVLLLLITKSIHNKLPRALKRDTTYKSFYTQNFRYKANIKVKDSYYKQAGRKYVPIIDHPCQPHSDHTRRN